MANETIYVSEDEAGFQVRVPANKLEDWQKAQNEPPSPLTEAERAVADRIVASLYGSKPHDPSAVELAAQLEYERKKNAAEWEEFLQEIRMIDPATGQVILTKEYFDIYFSAYKERRATCISQREAQTSHEVRTEYDEPNEENSEDNFDTDYDSSYDSLPETPACSTYMPQNCQHKHRFKDPAPVIVSICSAVLCILIWFAVFFSSNHEEKPDDPWASPYVSDHATIYVGSVNSDLVHLSTCQYAKNISGSNKIYYENVDYALRDGRSRCSSCLSVPSATSSDSSALIPVSPPPNGHILSENGDERIAPLSIKTSGTGYYFIKLKDALTKDTVLSFFLHGGKTADIDAPLGTYELYYTSGEEWYGTVDLFGEHTHYAKADELFEFYEEDGYVNGWTVTLYPVQNGNLSTSEISPDEF